MRSIVNNSKYLPESIDKALVSRCNEKFILLEES